jgi:PTS system mannose-specific IIA component
MTVGLLIVSHDPLGQALLETATNTLGQCPLAAEVIPVSRDGDPDAFADRACEAAARVSSGAGILVLTDMYGSTPSNIACRLLQRDDVRVVSGVNLPMLIRVFNYAGLDLDGLAQKALSGGHDGVILCDRPSHCDLHPGRDT